VLSRNRLAEHGPNVLAKDQRPSVGRLLWHAVLNPLVIPYCPQSVAVAHAASRE
jgi:hypothetical protein